MILLAVILGALTWTLLEYVIHRFLGHHRKLRGNPFGIEHVRHHAEGGYFAPSWKKGLVALIFGVVLGVPSALLVGGVGIAFVAGLLGWYLLYETLHRLEHVHGGIGPYGRWARRHHFTHHFVDPRSNHGVTTPLWDLVFRTYRRPTTIPVPHKLAMPWLINSATGEVLPVWARTYQLVRKAAVRDPSN